METTTLSSTRFSENGMLKKALIICGLLASLLYIGSDIVSAISWKEYSYTAQSVSELRAIGAPTRPFLVPILIVYALLEIAFGLGISRAASRKRTMRITGLLLIGLGIVDLIAPFLPMHLRGTESTLIDKMHIGITIVTVLLILLIIGFGAMTDGKWFRLYSFGTLLIIFGCGIWAFMDAPDVANNLPTPWLGVRERINIYGYMLWLAVLSIVLLRVENKDSDVYK